MLIRKLGEALIATTLAIFLAIPSAGAQQSFSPQQQSFSAQEKAEVEKIIRDYLLENPELLVEVMEELERRRQKLATSQAERRLEENQAEIYQSKYDFVTNPDGEVPFVEFFDYQCGYCKRAHASVMKIRSQRRDVRFIFKEFPILGPVSTYSSRAAIASRQQGKYVEYHDALMNHRGKLTEEVVLKIAQGVGLDVRRLKADMERPEVQEAIDATLALASVMNIRGTPTFIIGKALSPGAIAYRKMVRQIEEARNN